ncbi:MAG: prepilin-type N-terminal cleavage/methylation domain-containing protein [Pseudomonadota bacterium]
MIAVRAERGLTLIELLIAMTIGIIITGTIAQALALSSAHFRRSQALAQMQEQADVALQFLAEDIRHAGHWGLAGDAALVAGRSISGDDNPLTLQQPARCSAQFALNLAHPVEVAADTARWACGLAPDTGNDSLVVRYASTDTVAAQPHRLQVIASPNASRVIDNGDYPLTGPPLTELLNLHVRGYYIAPRSSLFPEQPVLRRLTLSALSTRPTFIDEEISAGVERLVLRAAVDSTGDGFADLTLSANDPRLAQFDANGAPLMPVLGIHVTMVNRSADTHWRTPAPQQLSLAGRAWMAPADGRLRFVSEQFIPVHNAMRAL